MKERKREMKREKEKEKESAREEKILTSSANEGSLSKAKKKTTEKTFFIFFVSPMSVGFLFFLFFSFLLCFRHRAQLLERTNYPCLSY